MDLEQDPRNDLSDAQLVRYIDRACEGVEESRIEAHLVTCRACSNRLERVRHRLGRLSDVLALADLPGQVELVGPAGSLRRPGIGVPGRAPSARGRQRLRVAAMILLTLAGAFTFSPVRAWVSEGLSALIGGAVPEVAGTQPETAGFGVITFATTTEDFVLHLVSAQAEGAVVLRAAAVYRASAQVVEGDGTEELAVLPTGLQIRNSADSRATYRITVPETLRSVSVRIGDGPMRRFDLREADIPASWTVRLNGG